VAGSSLAIRPALPHGWSGGGELGEERGPTGGSRRSVTEARAWGLVGRKLPTTLFQILNSFSDPFSIFKFLFQLNKSTRENKK
jgi:hypothetical protein